jgi:hypothetical protein
VMSCASSPSTARSVNQSSHRRSPFLRRRRFLRLAAAIGGTALRRCEYHKNCTGFDGQMFGAK